VKWDGLRRFGKIYFNGASGRTGWSAGANLGTEIGHGCFIVLVMALGSVVACPVIQQVQETDGIHRPQLLL
jgi:hypothetical protein